MRKYGNPTQEQLAAFFGIDQGTVYRYLRYCDMILAKILPTPDAVSRKIRNTHTIEGLREIVLDLTVIVDGTHVDIQCTTDRESRKEGKTTNLIYISLSCTNVVVCYFLRALLT